MNFDSIPKPPLVRPKLNIGSPFDISTGDYLIGKHGESIMNGGLSFFTGVGGRGNSYKSMISDTWTMLILDRYLDSKASIFDTELSKTIYRYEHLSSNKELFKNLNNFNFESNKRFSLTDNSILTGNAYFDILKKFGQDKINDSKNNLKTTPFLDRDQTNIKVFTPTISFFDSISQLLTDSVLTIYDKNEIGEGGMNTESMKSSAAKSQMISQFPVFTAKTNTFVIGTAHMGDVIKIDPYAPSQKKLHFLKNINFKKTPENFTLLANNLWYVMGLQVLLNKVSKTPEYPRDEHDNLEGDTDLQILQIMNTRGKSGPAGIIFEIILSQSDGLLPGLTNFNFIKSFDRYGIGGNDRNYYIELLPDVKLQRTTIRKIIHENEQLQRSLEIVSEMKQIEIFMAEHRELFCSPKELYENLKNKGYDWNRLLNTRGYWVFEEDENHFKPFLSTLDLLKMNKGYYHPWWYGELKK